PPRQIHEINLAGPRETGGGLPADAVAHAFVRARHLPERDLMLAKELQRDARVIPASVAAAKILRRDVLLRQVVSKIVLHARTAGHKVAPKHEFPHLVNSVRTSRIGRCAVEFRVVRVRRYAPPPVPLFVAADRPWPAGTPGFANPVVRPPV